MKRKPIRYVWKSKPIRYVWCAEDEKYGLMGVYYTKKAAEIDYGPHGKERWDSGYGGQIFKRKVQGITTSRR